MSWENVRLVDVCRPRQWKTLSTNNLLEDGYPVYGANGKIGFYNEYTHEFPTLTITCRGATCGTVHITEPKSYINGNAMALDSISSNVDIKFLYYYFLNRGFQDVISGSAQPQITGEGLSKVTIPLPPLATQKRIADILDNADALRRKDQELLTKYDQLAQAIFIDMFGDPVKNEKGWEVKKGEYLLEVIGGAAFKSTDYLNDGIPLIRIGTVNKGFFDENQLVYLPEYFKESFSKYLIYPGDLLITLTGTVGKDDYGNVYIMTDKYESCLLNQRVAKLKIIDKLLNPRYLEYILKQKEIKAELTGVSRGVRQANISNSDIYTLNIITPPIELQNEFEQRIKLLDAQKGIQQNSHSTSLFSSLIQQAFNGTLVS